MENGSLEDVFSTDNADFPLLCWSTRGLRIQTGWYGGRWLFWLWLWFVYDYVIIMMASFIRKNYCSWDTNLASRWIYEHLNRYLPINQRKSLPNVRISHSSTSQMFLQVLPCTIFYPHDICMERDSDGWNHETWLWNMVDFSLRRATDSQIRSGKTRKTTRQERLVNPPVISSYFVWFSIMVSFPFVWTCSSRVLENELKWWFNV